ncbi:MAG TPA: ATP-dependent Clp protease ATP-binding subunit ClpX [Lachnospiraceae bacterium]|nr:ATP-dependent Clp protease ATP-binding subunit ClpX [Lachnospiraceae bacterium]
METCAFCGLKLSQVANLVKSPIHNDIYICDKCSEISFSVINGDINKKSSANLRKNWKDTKNMEVLEKKSKWDDTDFNMTPSEIHKELDKYVIGQERAKRILSVALYNHYKRLNDKNGLIKKSNILLAGSTGCGKTLLARTLARILNVPFAIVDATSLTETGYVGENVESCLIRLLQITDNDIEFAQRGIVYIDEIDKIARTGSGRSTTRDISGEGVQSGLLKIIEGSEISIPINSNRKNPNEETVLFNTRNVLFICGGAFEGLFDNASQTNPIGFQTIINKNFNEDSSTLSYEALTKFGLLPEFLGRFSILCPLQPLYENELIRVLTEPEDAITKEYQLLFKQDNIKLEYNEDALKEIARIAIEKKTGARGLRSILEDVMLDVMYDMPDQKDTVSKCIITKECIETRQPKVIKKRQRRKKVAITTSS